MNFAKKLSVITPVSRPELLPTVALSVPDKAEWILVTDGPLEIPHDLRSHILIEGPKTGQWGDVQRQIGLEAATRPFIYFLDDDNMMLPMLADLLIPYLENGGHAGVLFGLLAHLSNKIYIWPPPAKVKVGRIDTAMFFGRQEAILDLHGWPNLQGKRYADFIFLEAFEKKFGLSRLPAIYGFHNAVDLLRQLEPDLCPNPASHELALEALPAILNRYLVAAGVPPWW